MAENLQINQLQLFTKFFDKLPDRKIKYLVLHHIADNSLSQAINTLKENQVSSHYIINNDGEIFNLVEEKDIAYHAGISFWNGEFNLNKNSIGIEFFSLDPFTIGFTKKQINSGIKLCQKIIKEYKIEAKNIIGHSDIAYNKETGFLDRKQDPSHLFSWKKLAQKNIGIWPDFKFDFRKEKVLFELGSCDEKITKIKENLKKFGYKLENLNEVFDEELKNLVIVFNRRFNPKGYLRNKDKWLLSSSKILENLITKF